MSSSDADTSSSTTASFASAILEPVSSWFVFRSENNDNNEGNIYLHDPMLWLQHSQMDNLSFLCQGLIDDVGDDGKACRCPTSTGVAAVTWSKILHWIKLIVVHIARSYYAHAAVLVVLPCLVGLVLGYTMASWNHSKQTTPTPPQATKPTTKPTTSTWFPVAVSNSLARYMIWLGVLHQESHETTTTTATNDKKTFETKLEALDIDPKLLPKHVAVIMDGNRRYGRQHFQGNTNAGHEAGGHKVMDMCDWCSSWNIEELTLFAFSTENWNRSPSEIAALMALFVVHLQELRTQAQPKNIRVRFIMTDPSLLPPQVLQGAQLLQQETQHCTGLRLNVCLSYGSRHEITMACQSIAQQCLEGTLQAKDITETTVSQHLQLSTSSNTAAVDILIRTSGEYRLSNFLLWQLAYTELFFVPCTWPEFTHDQFRTILTQYAQQRKRRFGT